MTGPFATIVDGGALLEVVWVSVLAGVGLTLVFSLTIAGAARASHQRRDGRVGRAFAWTAVAAFGALVCIAAVVAAVTVMLHK